MADMQAELAEAEERNKALELKLTHAAALEQQAQSECEVLDAQADKLRQELSAASLRAERAAQIRNTCRRLSSLEGRLKPIADERDGGHKQAAVPALRRHVSIWQTLLHVVAILTACAVAVMAALLAYTYVQGDSEKICRPPKQTGQLHVSTQPFDPDLPPLMLGRSGYGFGKTRKVVNQSQTVTWGEAAMHVCSRGTTEQSFLRRDDCDGCLCPLGSLWMHYKDARFFGDGEYCVPEKQWKDCISRWSCCKNKPNYCWDFIFDGARQDPQSEDYCLVVDTCSHHMACYAMLRRRRRWELVREFRPSSDVKQRLEITVGVPLEAVGQVNRTIHMNPNLRGWGLPSSVLRLIKVFMHARLHLCVFVLTLNVFTRTFVCMHACGTDMVVVRWLIKVAPTTSPQEWEPTQTVSFERRLTGGQRHRLWQLVSYYSISAKSMSGDEFTLADFTQHEHVSYLDSA